MWWTQANRIRNCNIRERKTFLFCCKRQGTFSETKMTRKSGQHRRTNTRIYFQWGYGLLEKWCHVVVDRSSCFEGIWRFHFQVFFSAKTEHGPHSSKLVICVVLCIVCVYMCTVLLPPGDNPIAVNKYITWGCVNEQLFWDHDVSRQLYFSSRRVTVLHVMWNKLPSWLANYRCVHCVRMCHGLVSCDLDFLITFFV